MRRITVSILLLIITFMCSSVQAVKAPLADHPDYGSHLALHIGDTQAHVTGNYIKIRTKPSGNKVIGHLEIADSFTIEDVSDHWVKVTVTYSDRTSPDSRVGMNGWIDGYYVDCGCTEENYYLFSVEEPDYSGSALWKEAYLQYLYSIDDQVDPLLPLTYALIYVDQDGIPEIAYMPDGTEAGGSIIVTYQNGAVEEVQTRRLYFTYIPKGNLLNNCAGHQDYYYDDIYTISDGRWVQIACGQYFDFEAYKNIKPAEYTYVWNDEVVTSQQYAEQLAKVYDSSKAIAPVYTFTYDQLITYLSR